MDFASIPFVELKKQKAFRLVNSKFPPITLFDDVADAEEFDAIYALQSITNSRLQNEVGALNLLPKEEIPFKIKGCSYAVAPFVHVNPDGSRFSDGSFGALYLADTIETAIAETKYHQERTFQNIEGLHYDTLVMRSLTFVFSGHLLDLLGYEGQDIYDSEDYSIARSLGITTLKERTEGIQYHSVRKSEAVCWVLFTPKNIIRAVQSKHYEFVFDGARISEIRMISKIPNVEFGNE